MRRTNGVEPELTFKNVCIKLLHSFWCGIANIRVCLMAVETAKLELFTIEIEAVSAELCLAESNLYLVGIDNLAIFKKLGSDEIEVR
jgi:hypothetical protein